MKRKLDPFFETWLCDTFAGAKTYLARNEPDAILLDASLGAEDPPRAVVVDAVKQLKPQSALIILSGYEDPEYVKTAILQQASHYLFKGRDDTDGQTLASNLRRAILVNESIQTLRGIE